MVKIKHNISVKRKEKEINNTWSLEIYQCRRIGKTSTEHFTVVDGAFNQSVSNQNDKTFK